MKKIKIVISVLLLLAMMCPTCITAFAEETQEQSNNQINVYLIAGQSNAAGWSPVDTVNFNEYDPKYKDGFDNVLYYGKVPTSNTLTYFNLKPVKAGLGYTANHFGPELGMASVLQSESNKVAIVKYAIGGSFLAPEKVHMNSATGTWTSPSYIKENSIDTTNTNIGKHYKDWESNLMGALVEMKKQGYDPVIKGIVWHQGEAETDPGFEAYANDYARMLTCLINDFRASISALMGKDYSTLPVVIGRISKAHDLNPSVDVVRNAQQLVSDTMENVMITDSIDFRKVDSWHLTGADMITHGQNCAKLFVDTEGKRKLSVYSDANGIAGGGGYISVGEMATVSYTAKTGFDLQKAMLKTSDGEVDITDKFVDGIYTFEMPDKACTVNLSFAPLPSYKITASAENGNIYRTNAHRAPFKNESVVFTFIPDEGYTLDKVLVNGVEVQAKQRGEGHVYTVKVESDVEVEAVFTELPEEERVSSNNLTPIPPKMTFKSFWKSLFDLLFGWMFK